MLTTWAARFWPLPLLLGCLTSLASAEWPEDWLYYQRDRGWHFYREERPIKPLPPPASEPESPEAPDPEPSSVPSALPDIPTEGPALERWLAATPDTEIARLVPLIPAASIRAWIPILMDHALTTLDRASVRKYLLVQHETMRRSERFSHIWQEVIWTDAGFDRPNGMPLGGLAQTVYDEETAQQRHEAVTQLRDSTSLLLVVQPNCRPCTIAWQILTAWAQQYHFTARVIASSALTLDDGTSVPAYPQIVESLQVLQFPSLYLVQPATHTLTRLGTGILSEQDIATRLLRLVPDANPEGALTHATPLPAPLSSPSPALP